MLSGRFREDRIGDQGVGIGAAERAGSLAFEPASDQCRTGLQVAETEIGKARAESLPAQGEQRRPSLFNIRRDNPPGFAGGYLLCPSSEIDASFDGPKIEINTVCARSYGRGLLVAHLFPGRERVRKHALAGTALLDSDNGPITVIVDDRNVEP